MSDEITTVEENEEIATEEPAAEIQPENEEEIATEEPAAEIQEEDESSDEIKAETEEELEAEIKEAIEEGASEEEVQEMIRKFVLKVDGKEYVREIDLNNEEEVQKQLQMALKGQKSMQELAEIKKLYSNELQRLKADPFRVLKELDPEFDEMSAINEYVEAMLKEQEKTPEQRQREAEQKELEELRAEKQKLEEERQRIAQEKEMAALAQQIETDIMSALDNDPELIADRETVALVAQEMIWAEEKGLNIDAKMAIAGVKEHLKKQFSRYSSRFKDPKALKQYMGDDLLAKLREERKQQAEKVVKNLNSVKSTSKVEAKKEEAPKIKLSDIMSGRAKL